MCLIKLDKLIDNNINENIISGIAISVSIKGINQFKYFKGSNFFNNFKFDKEVKKTDININSIFDLASLTKILCGFTLTANLIDKNIINLDTSIVDIFNDNAIYINKDLHKIKIKHLLNHSSGLPSYIALYKTIKSKSSVYSYIKSNTQLNYETGTKHIYSDLGYILLSEILELYYDAKLNDAFNKIVAKNLNLKEIGYIPINTNCPREHSLFVSTGFSTHRNKNIIAEVHDDNAYIMDGVSAHAGLFSNIEELCSFGNFILASYNGLNALISKKTFLDLIKPNKKTDWTNAWHYKTINSSSGSFLSANSIGMTGFTGSSLWVDFDNSLVISILANRTINPNAAKFGSEIDKFSILRPKIHDLVLEDFL